MKSSLVNTVINASSTLTNLKRKQTPRKIIIKIQFSHWSDTNKFAPACYLLISKCYLLREYLLVSRLWKYLAHTNFYCQQIMNFREIYPTCPFQKYITTNNQIISFCLFPFSFCVSLWQSVLHPNSFTGVQTVFEASECDCLLISRTKIIWISDSKIEVSLIFDLYLATIFPSYQYI